MPRMVVWTDVRVKRLSRGSVPSAVPVRGEHAHAAAACFARVQLAFWMQKWQNGVRGGWAGGLPYPVPGTEGVLENQVVVNPDHLWPV